MLDEMESQTHDASTKGRTRNLRWINMAKERFRYDVNWPQLRRENTLTLVTGQFDYVLPGDVLIPMPTMTIPTEDVFIREVSPEIFKIARPGAVDDEPSQRDRPQAWMQREWVGVELQPSAASAIRCLSSNNADVTVVTIEGIANGEIDREVITLVAGDASTTKTFTRIDSVSKKTTSLGVITVSSNAAAVTNAKLGPLHITKRYINIRFSPVPDAALTVRYDFIPWGPDLINDSDIPLIPERHHEGIVERALMYALKYGKNSSYRIAASAYQDRLEFARRETGRDAGQVKQWIWGGDIIFPDNRRFDFDFFLRNLFWGS